MKPRAAMRFIDWNNNGAPDPQNLNTSIVYDSLQEQSEKDGEEPEPPSNVNDAEEEVSYFGVGCIASALAIGILVLMVSRLF